MLSSNTISITSDFGEEIIGDFYTSQNKRKLIILCLGYGEKRTNNVIDTFVKMLHTKGYDVFCFDFSKKVKAYDIKKQGSELISVINHFIEYKEIVLIGTSLGALNASIAAIQSKRITHLITVNGFFGFPLLAPNMLKIYLSFLIGALISNTYRRVWKYYRKQLIFKNITIPTLVIHSKDDHIVSYRQSQILYSKISSGTKTYRQLSKIDHGLLVKGSIEMVVNIISEWLK